MARMTVKDEEARRQCEQLEKAWQVLNDATVELNSRIVNVPLTSTYRSEERKF